MEKLLKEKIRDKIVFRSLNARRTSQKKYLGPDGTNLLIEEVIDEELMKQGIELSNIVSFKNIIKTDVFNTLDDIATSKTEQNNWERKYEEWLTERMINMALSPLKPTQTHHYFETKE